MNGEDYEKQTQLESVESESLVGKTFSTTGCRMERPIKVCKVISEDIDRNGIPIVEVQYEHEKHRRARKREYFLRTHKEILEV